MLFIFEYDSLSNEAFVALFKLLNFPGKIDTEESVVLVKTPCRRLPLLVYTHILCLEDSFEICSF